MCVNSKWIYNKYIRKSLFVNCGHCPACLQQKANKRTQRIKNNFYSDDVCVFLTLTYAPECVPFILVSDLVSKNFPIPIYRSSKRYQAMTKDGLCLFHRTSPNIIGSIDLIDDEYYQSFSVNSLPLLRNASVSNSVGVIFYKDVQNFIKRLRQNLLRVYNYQGKFSFFIASEYGETYYRPHFHVLLFIPRGFVELFRSACIKSWEFANGRERFLRFEIARNVASYVSSYVNCFASLPKVFTHRYLRPKCSYSKGFGMALSAFSPSEIQRKVDGGNLTYSVFRSNSAGEVSNILVPRYVVNRYFPKFKGYFRFTDNQIYELLSRPSKFRCFQRYLDCTSEEIELIIKRLRNARDRYISLTGISQFDYAVRYVSTWRCYNSTLYKLFFLDQELLSDSEKLQCYDNICDLYFGIVRNDTLADCLAYLDTSEMPTDPNTFARRVESTYSLIDLFYKKQKTRKVNEFVNEQNF